MKKAQGFAVMDAAVRRDIASKGGKAAHAQGLGHEWSKDEARAAGRLGGLASAKKRLEKLQAEYANGRTSVAGIQFR